MTKDRRRLIFIVAGHVVWTGGLVWLIVVRHVLATHGRLFTTLLLLLVPPAIYLDVLAMRRMPWMALSMKTLIVGLVLLTISAASELLFGLEHPALNWVSNGGAILSWLSMLLGLISSVRESMRRKQDKARL